MTLKRYLSKIYRGLQRTFIYNRAVENIFFPKGFSKKINGEAIRIPFRFSNYYASVYEPEKTALIRQVCKPGDTAIDIGAHIGIFSYFISRAVGSRGKVFSFEPAPFTFNILQKTIEYNKLDNVAPQQKAVSKESGELSFYIFNSSRISNGNSISAQNTSGASQLITVKSIALDSLLDLPEMARLSFIKIDAEGAEYDILQGAEKLIRKFRPYITLEIHPKSFDDPQASLAGMYDLIISFGYAVQFDGQPVPRASFIAWNTYIEVILIPAP